MKKNDWIILTVSSIYSYLFYNESLGLNLVFFTLSIIVGFIILDKNKLQNKNWVITALFSLLSSISEFYYGNSLSILASMISLIALIGIGLNKKTSALFSIIYGAYSILVSPYYFIKEITHDKFKEVSSAKFKRKILLIIIPIIVTLLFFTIYKNSNPIFNSFANKINFNWISWGWIFFTISGLFICFGFYSPKNLPKLSIYDEEGSLGIKNVKIDSFTIWGKTIFTIDEFFSAKILFILINILILIVNILDYNFIFIDKNLPEGLTFAQYLHQGVGMLVISILISIAIILFYFRGQLNFYEKSKSLKILAYIWILQNGFMLLSVVMKNSFYIENYGLTYKRIGIYIYAVLTLIGLLTTFLKVWKIKSNLYLIRTNGWIFFFLLITSSFINWDQTIVNYNSKGKHEIDSNYLLSLSNQTIPSLINYASNIKNKKSQIHFEIFLQLKIKKFKETSSQINWKSLVYLNQKTLSILKSPQSKFILTSKK